MTEQRTEEWLKAASPEQIADAHKAGELDALMGVELNDLGNRVSDLRGLPQ